MAGKSWTPKEIKTLETWYGRISVPKIQRELLPHRTRASIATMIRDLRLSETTFLKWEPWEIKILKRYYPKMTASELQSEHLPQRTIGSIRAAAVAIDILKDTPWTASEYRKLIMHRDKSIYELYKLFPNHSEKSVRQACEFLRIQYKELWTEKELNILKDNYKKLGMQVCSLLPGRTRQSVRSKIRRMKLTRGIRR